MNYQLLFYTQLAKFFFLIITIKDCQTEELEHPRGEISALKVMAIRDERVTKQKKSFLSD